MSDHDEQTDLESLVASPGWVRFCAFSLREYDSNFLEHVNNVLADAANDDKRCIDKMRQMAAVRQQVRRLLEWPEKRIKDLQRLTQQRDSVNEMRTRRGGL